MLMTIRRRTTSLPDAESSGHSPGSQMGRCLLLSLIGALALVATTGASASQLIDRNATSVRLAANSKGEALLTYRALAAGYGAGTAQAIMRAVLAGDVEHALAEIDAETAHLKAIGMADGLYGVANLVSSFSPPELSLPSGGNLKSAQLVVNARVATAPETLTDHVEQAVIKACAKRGATPTFQQTQSFRPGRPVPTHRILQPTG